MRKIRRRKNYTNYIIIACICIFSVMGIGYGYLQQSLDINMRLSRKNIVDIAGQDVDVVTSGDGLYEDQYEDGRYIYRGSKPNNYIKFNNELWRIIAKESDGTYKIIKVESISVMPFDDTYYRAASSNTYCDSLSEGCNVYGKVSGTYRLGNKSGTVTEDSYLADYLNGDYYNSLTSIARNQIQTHSFNIGGILNLAESRNDSIEKNLSSEKAYTWTGNIGLPNVTDYLRASTNPSCTSATDTYSPSTANKCTLNYIAEDMEDWTYYWTINGYSYESYISSTGVWTIQNYSGAYLYYAVANDLGASLQPPLFLKSNIQITGGEGTEANPYVID